MKKEKTKKIPKNRARVVTDPLIKVIGLFLGLTGRELTSVSRVVIRGVFSLEDFPSFWLNETRQEFISGTMWDKI